MVDHLRRVSTIALVLGSCVPAGVDEDPHGAAGIVVRASPASRGEPFVTSDGWTVYVDRFAAQVLIEVHRAAPALSEDSIGGEYVFSAASDQQFVIRAVPAGPVAAVVSFFPRTLDDSPLAFADPPVEHGVDAALDARFGQAADTDDPSGAPLGYGDLDAGTEDETFAPPFFGPTVVIAAHAEKGDRIVTFDFSLAASPSEHIGRPFQVQANALVSFDVTARAEVFFTSDTGALVFDDIAEADRDQDGHVSPAELRRLRVPPCPDCTPGAESALVKKALDDNDELAMKLIARAANIFGK
jgi:hypothetical protein